MFKHFHRHHFPYRIVITYYNVITLFALFHVDQLFFYQNLTISYLHHLIFYNLIIAVSNHP